MITLGYYGFAFFIFILVGMLMLLYNYLFSDIKRQKKLLDEKENKLLRLYQSVEDALDDFNDSLERGIGEINVKLKDLGDFYAEVERSTRGLGGNIRTQTYQPPVQQNHTQPQTTAPSVRVPAPQKAQTAESYRPQAPQPQAQAAARPAAPAQAEPVRPVVRQPAAQPSAPVQQAPIQQQAPVQAPVQQAAPVVRTAAPSAAPTETVAQSVETAAQSIKMSAPGPAAPAEPAAEKTQTMAPPPAFRKVMEVTEAAEPARPAEMGRNEHILALSNSGKSRSQIAKELGITLSEVDLVIGMNK